MGTKKYKAGGLFCGAGGLDLGFKGAGVEIMWAVDNNKDACATYKKHSPETEVRVLDVSKLKGEEVEEVDIVLGGFPCQGFSLAGKRDANDPRNKLYKEFVRLVEEKKPKCFIGENVKGLLTLGTGLEDIVRDFSEIGYDVYYELVNAQDYGVPQSRERVIFAGFRKDLGVKEFKIPEYEGEKRVLGDILEGREEPKPEDVQNLECSSMYMSRNRRRGYDETSFTILATARQIPISPSSPPMVKVCKDEWKFGEGETRRLSWQECALIQTFPEGMEFVGRLASKYKQIGNAVPVLLAEHVGKYVVSILDKH